MQDIVDKLNSEVSVKDTKIKFESSPHGYIACYPYKKQDYALVMIEIYPTSKDLKVAFTNYSTPIDTIIEINNEIKRVLGW